MLLVATLGCAGARVEGSNGLTYQAWAFGQGHASAGRCDRVATDVSDSTNSGEHRESKDDERGELCVTANGGRGSVGLWATVAAGFTALVAVMAGAL